MLSFLTGMDNNPPPQAVLGHVDDAKESSVTLNDIPNVDLKHYDVEMVMTKKPEMGSDGKMLPPAKSKSVPLSASSMEKAKK